MTVDTKLLKTLAPLDRLSGIAVEMLSREAMVRQLNLGERVFDIGDRSPYAYYLLEGEIEISSPDGVRFRLPAGSEQARHPFGSLVPRQVDATVASTAARVLCLDRDLVEKELTWGLSGTRIDFAVGADAGSGDQDSEWMTSLLHTPLFFRLPIRAVQNLFGKLEAFPVDAGEVIVHEGESGEYYYLIRRGRARVVRQVAGREVVLNRLKAPDGFGDEALISDQPRGATVIMESDGMLMRLAKRDFLDLMEAPAIKRMKREIAATLQRGGRAVVIDVRTEDEFAAGHLPDARNIPLYLLYLKSRSLAAGPKYVLYCDSGNRSEAATFLMTQRGFDAYLMEDAAEALAKSAAPDNP